MKDVLCLAAFAAKVLCLVVFVTTLKPDRIGVVQAPTTPEYCKTERSGAHGCNPKVARSRKSSPADL
jgi:hypothetical protein